MQGDPSPQAGIDCLQASWSGSGAESNDSPAAKDRLARLARAIETDVIPRLILAHRHTAAAEASHAAAALPLPGRAEIEAFVALVLSEDESRIAFSLAQMRERGMTVESMYLDLFAPTARHLGVLWEDDRCDFTTVTVALGRLQRLLRELSPVFGHEVAHPANGRRALFAQPPGEQHSFGLSMVAEFFRREGWDVIGGIGGAVSDAAATVRAEWVDVIGFSVGSEARLEWLRLSIAAARAGSRNADMCVLVGGPIFTLHPQWAIDVGADGSAASGKEAPGLAESLLSRGQARK